ncbi:beta-ketoacyl-ACP synthase III [Micromonospora tarensis]|uniref:Beta-ketoacyl-[acyl-carrier-protein] synthase III n=1 Tax=Micromonospora tarensis TaxID=2806100 RepID=A0ABS1YF49_9ACTN|nr:beta-ketoacyl-ACP synthase III [Micromonospora tarensis]MBM0276041.1 ketoacyl-ACP synthase III [Micromonospora tarensis]
MRGSKIVGAGHHQPARVLSNHDLATMVETSDEWIRSRVGIRERRIAGPADPLDLMAAEAAAAALRNAGVAVETVDLVVVATCTAVDRSPNIAARVARRLGMPSPATIDINVACSGFTHALATADGAVRLGSATNAVVIGVERLSDFTDWTDRTTCVLIGDGAGAVVLTAAEQPEISPVVWGSFPDLGEAVVIEGGGKFTQAGQTVYRWATTRLPDIARQICAAADITPDDLGGIVLHQANLRIIEPVAERIGATKAVVARDVIESGNTSAASIPIALSKLLERGELQPGAPVLLLGFGGGLSYAGQIVRCP